MVSSFCEKKLVEATILVQFQPFLTLIVCVLNLLCSLVATVANVLVIYALWKASSIPAKKLLLSLAFSDLAVGLFVQPMFGVVIAVMLNMAACGDYNFDYLCPAVLTTTMFSAYYLAGVSFFTIAAIALDRFLAVTLHLRYKSLVTDKRVSAGLAILWLATGLATVVLISLHNHNNLVSVIVQSVGFTVITVVYLRIYKVVRHHQNQILSQHQIQHDRAVKAAKEKKSALNAFLVYIISFGCYLPSLFSAILLDVNHTHVTYVSVAFSSIFLFFLNSSLNPFVYCWRYREIRNIVIRKARAMCLINDRKVHRVTKSTLSNGAFHKNDHARKT